MFSRLKLKLDLAGSHRPAGFEAPQGSGGPKRGLIHQDFSKVQYQIIDVFDWASWVAADGKHFFSRSGLQDILQAIDCNGSGSLDYTEFLAAMLDQKVYMQRDCCGRHQHCINLPKGCNKSVSIWISSRTAGWFQEILDDILSLSDFKSPRLEIKPADQPFRWLGSWSPPLYVAVRTFAGQRSAFSTWMVTARSRERQSVTPDGPKWSITPFWSQNMTKTCGLSGNPVLNMTHPYIIHNSSWFIYLCEHLYIRYSRSARCVMESDIHWFLRRCMSVRRSWARRWLMLPFLAY